MGSSIEAVTMCPTNLQIHGPLQAPLDDQLRETVRGLLRDGRRDIVLNLKHVLAIDAVGVGELINVYNLARSAQGKLHVVDAAPHVRETLELLGLFELLSGDAAEDATAASSLATL